MKNKKIVYIDMDGVLVDLASYIHQNYNHLGNHIEINDIVDQDSIPFYNAQPIEGAIEAFNFLYNDSRFEPYILSTAPWANMDSLKAKRVWVERFLGDKGERRLILTHRKDLMIGDYLIDDRPNNGAAEFKGAWIKFGSEQYPDWASVLLKLDQAASNN
jgi:5'(3')-deoxyribonucleotidase